MLSQTKKIKRTVLRCVVALMMLSSVLKPSSSMAYDFEVYSGIDLTVGGKISHTSLVRTQKQASNIIGHSSTGNIETVYYAQGSQLLPQAGIDGTAPSATDAVHCGGVDEGKVCYAYVQAAGGEGFYDNNMDDGNLNYSRGLVANRLELQNEFDLTTEYFGLKGSSLIFYDAEVMEGEQEHKKFDSETKEVIGSDIRVLDFYLYGDVSLFKTDFSYRVGQQVIAWGESNIIPNGMESATDPIDPHILVLSGGDKTIGMVPTGAVLLSADLTDDLSIEMYGQYEFEPTVIPPAGSYLSFLDAAGAGSGSLCLGSGLVDDEGGMCLGRSEDKNAPDMGQYGLKVTMYSPFDIDGSMSFYYLNYHSKMPVINARSGIDGETEGLDAGYYLEYQSQKKLFGMSFNSTSDWGTFSGEVTYRKDVAMNPVAEEIIIAASATGVNTFGLYGDALEPVFVDGLDAESVLALGVLAADNPELVSSIMRQDGSFSRYINSQEGSQVGQVEPGGFFPQNDIDPYIERDIVQIQVSNLNIFNGDLVNADEVSTMVEVGAMKILDMPDQREFTIASGGSSPRGYEGTSLPYNATNITDHDNVVTSISWGMAGLVQASYSTLENRLTIQPRLLLKWDVNGVSPAQHETFNEGTRIMMLGSSFIYRNGFLVDLSYTVFEGNEDNNLLHDRDFASLKLALDF